MNRNIFLSAGLVCAGLILGFAIWGGSEETSPPSVEAAVPTAPPVLELVEQKGTLSDPSPAPSPAPVIQKEAPRPPKSPPPSQPVNPVSRPERADRQPDQQVNRPSESNRSPVDTPSGAEPQERTASTPVAVPSAPWPYPDSGSRSAGDVPASAPIPAPAPVPATATLPAGTVLDVRLSDFLTTQKNQSGDRFQAILERDLIVDGEIVAPKGSRLTGELRDVKDAGKVKGRAQMSLTLAELRVGEQSYPLETNMIAFEAEGTKDRDAKVIGGAAGIGAIIGAIAGGKKGAAVGATIGGGAGTATVLATEGNAIELKPEQKFSFRLEKDLEVSLN